MRVLLPLLVVLWLVLPLSLSRGKFVSFIAPHNRCLMHLHEFRVDAALTRGTVEEGLGIGGAEFEVGDGVCLIDPDGEPLKAC